MVSITKSSTNLDAAVKVVLGAVYPCVVAVASFIKISDLKLEDVTTLLKVAAIV